MARFEFTMVSDPMMRGLLSAGATGVEIVAYQMLVRGLPKDRSRTDCWMPADMAEEKVGMGAHTFSKALRSLSTKAFTEVGGRPVTVISKITRGCRGHSPHFEDNLGRLIAEGAYPPRVAAPTGYPTHDRNGDPKQAPIGEFSTLEWGPKTTQLGTQNDPIGDPNRHPINTRQDKHIPVGAAPPHAERGGAVSYGDQSLVTALRVVTGDGSPGASACALGGRAAAPAQSMEEYRAVARKLAEEGLDALSAGERDTYHVGHRIYAALA